MGTTLLMPIRTVVLASASPSRKRLLESCGINPEIMVSGVDEEDPKLSSLSPSELVIALAILKAHTVKDSAGSNALVIGCDSTFEFEGQSLGKPVTPENAIARAKVSCTPVTASLIPLKASKYQISLPQQSLLET